MDSKLDRSSLDANKADIIHEERARVDELDDSIEETDPGWAVWLIACTVSMGGFLFGIYTSIYSSIPPPQNTPYNTQSHQKANTTEKGYDTDVISAILVNLNEDLGHTLSSKETELITSITSGGALIGAILAGLTSDRYGRKLGIYLGCALFTAGAVLQAASFTVAQMTVGRLVVGLGVGSAAMIIPLYISELAPARFRGRMIVFDNLCMAGGQLVSYALGAGFTPVEHGWRYMIALGALPAILLAVLMPRCPESPRQLVSHGRFEEGGVSVSERSLKWQFGKLFFVPANLRALVTACMVMAVSQLGGFNTLMYYSSTLFSMVGFDTPVAVSIVVGGTNFLFGFINFAVIDRFGRRAILIVTILGMSLSLVVTAIAFHWIPITHMDSASTTLSGSQPWATILLLVTIILYVAFFAAGVAPVAWVGTELLPLEVRALGTMINSVTCRGCNLIISSTFLSMMKARTPSGTFAFYAGICFVGWLFVLACYAEVHGMPLEDVSAVFEKGFGVKEAKILQRELKERKRAEVRQEGLL
ncbi:Myo-inositol transporter [Penicillium antarcticum]|uniref:Myo-inositol transporter n=1 Tax=Penicillium antarcticum TaxID=416450 RepID=UPI00238F6786|nr:Myo-inositol transporter [Penicillium antarcticum]KAJ5295235.1 Myo-inositol transporter [Penicillium antarcticum]